MTLSPFSATWRPDVARKLNELDATIGSGVLSGFRNKIINGDFAVSQRGANFSSGGYTVDRWESYAFSGNSLDIRSFVFANTVDVVPLVPSYVRLSFTGAVAANATLLAQKIEDVRTLSGRRVTLTFYARMGSGSAVIGANLGQRFGTGGSADVYINAPDFTLNGVWKKYSVVLNLPSVAGKTLGSGHNLRLTFSIKSASANAQINMTAVSVVEGDATAEVDPFSPRHIQQELALCQRYYQKVQANVRFISTASGQYAHNSLNWPEMRATPTAALVDAGNTVNVNHNSIDNPSPYGGRITITSAAAGDAFIIGRVYGLDAEL